MYAHHPRVPRQVLHQSRVITATVVVSSLLRSSLSPSPPCPSPGPAPRPGPLPRPAARLLDGGRRRRRLARGGSSPFESESEALHSAISSPEAPARSGRSAPPSLLQPLQQRGLLQSLPSLAAARSGRSGARGFDQYLTSILPIPTAAHSARARARGPRAELEASRAFDHYLTSVEHCWQQCT
jgi:hypothetical protein